MRYILIILLFIGCRQEIDKPQKTRQLIFEDCRGLPNANRTIGKGRFNKRPKNDTVIVTDPGTNYTGVRVIHADGDGEQVSSSWGTFYATPSGMDLTYVVDSMNKALAWQGNVIVVSDVSTFNLCPLAYRQKGIFTENNEWYGTAGGLAYRNSFGTNEPFFVFTDQIYHNVKYVSMAGVHEAGHTLGLPHDVDESFVDGKFIPLNSYSTGPNYMGAGWNYAYHIFETVSYDYYGKVWNQFLTIDNTLK